MAYGGRTDGRTGGRRPKPQSRTARVWLVLQKKTKSVSKNAHYNGYQAGLQCLHQSIRDIKIAAYTCCLSSRQKHEHFVPSRLSIDGIQTSRRRDTCCFNAESKSFPDLSDLQTVAYTPSNCSIDNRSKFCTVNSDKENSFISVN